MAYARLLSARLCRAAGREPAHLVEKLGRYGRFVGCGNYPECKYTRPIEGEGAPEPEPTGEMCPECGNLRLFGAVARRTVS